MAGLTQREVAERAALGRPTLANIEKGRQRVLYHQLLDIARALGVDPRELLAAGNGIVVIREPFEDDGVSGVLIREPSRIMIIVNAANALVRQRFTIAHEIGHFELHQGDVYL